MTSSHECMKTLLLEFMKEKLHIQSNDFPSESLVDDFVSKLKNPAGHLQIKLPEQNINVHHYQRVKISFKRMWSPDSDLKYSTREAIQYLSVINDMKVFRCESDLILKFLDDNKSRKLLLHMNHQERTNLATFSKFLLNFRIHDNSHYERKFQNAKQGRQESFRTFYYRIERFYKNSKPFILEKLTLTDIKVIEWKFRQGIFDTRIKYHLCSVKRCGDLEDIIQRCQSIKQNLLDSVALPPVRSTVYTDVKNAEIAGNKNPSVFNIRSKSLKKQKRKQVFKFLSKPTFTDMANEICKNVSKFTRIPEIPDIFGQSRKINSHTGKFPFDPGNHGTFSKTPLSQEILKNPGNFV